MVEVVLHYKQSQVLNTLLYDLDQAVPEVGLQSQFVLYLGVEMGCGFFDHGEHSLVGLGDPMEVLPEVADETWDLQADRLILGERTRHE